MKYDYDRLFERAFQAWIGPETAWFERNHNCSGWSLGGSKTRMESEDTPCRILRGFL